MQGLGQAAEDRGQRTERTQRIRRIGELPRCKICLRELSLKSGFNCRNLQVKWESDSPQKVELDSELAGFVQYRLSRQEFALILSCGDHVLISCENAYA